MKKNQINLTDQFETGNVMHSLNHDVDGVPNKDSYDKLSLWTLASDVKISANMKLDTYYSTLMNEMAEDEYQYDEMVEFLRSVGFGTTEYTDINTMAARLGTTLEPVFEAVQQITGKTLNDASPQGMVNLMQSIDTRLQEVLEKLDINATGTQEIVNALDSL